MNSLAVCLAFFLTSAPQEHPSSRTPSAAPAGDPRSLEEFLKGLDQSTGRSFTADARDLVAKKFLELPEKVRQQAFAAPAPYLGPAMKLRLDGKGISGGNQVRSEDVKDLDVHYLLRSAEFAAASEKSKVPYDSSTERSLKDYYEKLAQGDKDKLESVGSAQIVDGIRRYLSVKQQTHAVVNESTPDFDWRYFADPALDFVRVTVDGKQSSPLFVEIRKANGNDRYRILVQDQQSIVVPFRNGGFGLSTKVEKIDAYWNVDGLGSDFALDPSLALTMPKPADWIRAGCRVEITTEPDGATILFDGVPHHMPSPAKLVQEPRPEAYELRIQHAGYVDWVEKLTLERKKPITRHIVLTPLTEGLLEIASVPPRAALSVDGKTVDKSTDTWVVLLPGDHNVSMHLDGYQDWHDKVTSVAGQRSQKTVTLSAVPPATQMKSGSEPK